MDNKNSMDLVIEEYKKHVDISLLEENLKLTPEQRIQAVEEFNQFREELQAAMRDRDDKIQRVA